eukprot:TRINITY_DN15205_c0_g1_i2.p1 TRINITY_DN15205_c0_g1~~TRINITY_DN15205_c0_g1_i2.p1  ORF type:complete len:121 (-),score=14.61 TRINITY_DN15205_c0_g1_i2:51-413(-)
MVNRPLVPGTNTYSFKLVTTMLSSLLHFLRCIGGRFCTVAVHWRSVPTNQSTCSIPQRQVASPTALYSTFFSNSAFSCLCFSASAAILCSKSVSYTHLRAHETPEHLVCRLLLEKKKKKI